MLALRGFLPPNRPLVDGPKREVAGGAGASTFFYSLGFAAVCGNKLPPALFSAGLGSASTFFGIVLAKRLLPVDVLDLSKMEVV